MAIPTTELTSPPQPAATASSESHPGEIARDTSPSTGPKDSHTVVRPPSPSGPASSPYTSNHVHGEQGASGAADGAIPFHHKPGGTVYAAPSELLEAVAFERSASVWVWDDAVVTGFGARLAEWAARGEAKGAEVFSLQTRAGAGSSLVGYVKQWIANAQAGRTSGERKPITLFATSTTLPLLVPSLHALTAILAGAGEHAPQIILNVGTTALAAETLAFEDATDGAVQRATELAAGGGWTVAFAGTGEEIIRLAGERVEGSRINIVETTFAGREIGRWAYPAEGKAAATKGYTAVGPASAHTTVLVASSHLASLLAHSPAASSQRIIALTSLAHAHLGELAASLLQAKHRVAIVADSEDAAAALRDALMPALVEAAYAAPGKSEGIRGVPRVEVIGGGVEGVSKALKTGNGVANGHANGHAATNGAHPVHPPTAQKIAAGKTITFFSSPGSPLPINLAHIYLSSPGLRARLARFGSSAVGAIMSVLRLAPDAALTGKGKDAATYERDAPLGLEERSDLVWISEPLVLKAHKDLFSRLNDNAIVVFSLPGWTEEDVHSKLSAADASAIKDRKARVFVLPTDPANDVDPRAVLIAEIAFLMLYTSSRKLGEGVKGVLRAFHGHDIARDLVEQAQAGLGEVDDVQQWEIEAEEKESPEHTAWEWDALAGVEAVSGGDSEGRPVLGDWALPAKNLLFREAFAYKSADDAMAGADTRETDEADAAITALRPSLPDETFLVTVSENRRLTPETYDRNVFHLAMDTSGTGLKYEIGEALGVHGWNDEDEVKDFIKWYGLDSDALVSYPSPHDGGKTYETRTVFQLIQQNLDIFGKPAKSFYASLSVLARSRDDERALRFIAAPEGAALFKKMSEKLTVTYADVLKQFTSARPSMEELIGLIPEIKPRHYSIASSQKAVGDSVELLIVTVDWTTPTGSPRYGQCTRYLAGLKVGQKVTVSIKPSVMKLPPLDSQPIIMAGLGTGAAPFRAFMQHRAWQKSQGMDVGPLLYYFGSRYRSQEYLYGEEIEAYIASGVIAHAGLAFSRDGKDKVYIQHKMMQDKKMLAKMLTATGPDAAYFYLCGPTWPVPDVYEALVGSLTEEAGKERKAAEDYIEELKEEERYVLEVY